MKPSTTALFLSFAAFCTAQLQNIPSCAKPCASNLPANCNLDVKCICSDHDWITGISCCVKNACPESDQTKTLQFAVQLCDTVQITLPSAASCPSGANTAAAGGESTAASAVSSATMVASSAAAGGKATTSSAVSMASSVAGSATSQAGNSATSATGSPTSTTATSSTSAEAATGAAQVFDSNMAAVGAAVAALALL